MRVPAWRAALGERVRDARRGKGWSWGAVDHRTSVPSATWRRMEQGRSVNDYALIEIAEALGWDPGECFRILADELDGQERTQSLRDVSDGTTAAELDDPLAGRPCAPFCLRHVLRHPQAS